MEIFLEPGEAVALNAGVLLTKVEEIVENSIQIAILDTSAACHMPDVLEMPYRPPLQDGYEAEEKAYTYRLAGPTCLAGDVIGDYSFAEPLKEVIHSHLKIWQSTRWSKTIHSMECVCRQLYWKIRMENAGWFDSSDTKILR